MRFTQSQDAYEQAASIAGRSLTRSKAPGRLFDIGTGPLYAQGGSGAVLRDVDGNDFIDMVCALGAISLGYETPRSPLNDTWVYSLPSRYEGLAARSVLETMAPWASQVRFVKTGSEATHAAYRIAKAATRRPFVLVGDWAYHGWHEWSQQSEDGIKLSVPYQHGCDISEMFRQRRFAPSEVAAWFVEPHRWQETSVAWLDAVRAFCTKHGILLVFDDMIYGLRANLRGSFGYFGVQPDLACFGKAIGNGSPVACVVGNAALAQHGELVSGTYSGDERSLRAVCDTLDTYRAQPVIEHLWARGQQLRDRMRAVLQRTGWADRAWFEGVLLPHQRLRFADAALGRAFAGHMARRGVLWHPDLCNVSYAHTREQVERVAEAAEASLKEMTS